MLLSMTGHGQALVQNEMAQVLAEIRTVNNRFLKLNINGDLAPAQMAELEGLVKRYVTRGSVNLRLKVQFLDGAQNYRLNEPVIKAYLEQLSGILSNGQELDVQALLSLPGTVDETGSEEQQKIFWPLVQQATEEALRRLTEMREKEGAFMGEDLTVNCDVIEAETKHIGQLAPRVAENFSKKITDRINQMLEQYDVSVEPSDVIREVGIFAERADISEEIVRLGSHIQQFRAVLKEKQSNGRKLDFLTQEMLRETNTIGSKANDAEIAGHVVEIKTAIERIREMVQNVE